MRPVRLAIAVLFLCVLCTYGRSDGPASPPAVPELVQSLKQADGKGRAQAAAELGRRDDLDADAKAALRQALADANRTVRGRAAVALWRLDRPPLKDVLPALLAARNDSDETVRTAADEAWAEIGPGVRAAMPFVRKSLASDVQSTQKAITALSQPGLDAVPAILDAVAEASPAVAVYMGPGGQSVTYAPPGATPQLQGTCVQALTKIGAAAVPVLTEALQDQTNALRESAATALGLMGAAAKPAVPTLISLFNDRDPLVRLRAAEAVGRLGSMVPEAVPALIAALAHKDANVRRAVVTALPNRRPIPAPVATALAQALDDPEPFVRVKAAIALTVEDPPLSAAVVALAEELRGRDAQLRIEAGQALEKLAGKARPALPTLMTLAGDRDRNARIAAGRVLARLGGAEAERGQKALRELLADEVMDVRLAAAEALWDLGFVKETAPILVAALGANNQTGNLRYRVQQRLRPNAAQTKEVVPILADALADGNATLRTEVLQLLQQLGQAAKPAAPAVARLLGNSDQRVRQAAFFTLSSIGGPPKEAVSDLIEALKVSDQQMRYQIVNLFSSLGPAAKDAAPAVKKLVADGPADVRVHALRVLLRISPDDLKDVLPALGELIRSSDQNVRTQARLVLNELNPPAVKAMLPVILDALKSDDRELRSYAISSLLRLNEGLPADVRTVLVELLKTGPPETRLSIANLLVQRGDKDAGIDALTELLRAESADIRLQAAESLWNHRVESRATALPALREGLKSDNVNTRLRVARLLLPTAPDAVGKAAAAVVSEVLRDGPPQLRSQALFSLQRIGTDALRDVAEGLRVAVTDQQPQTRLSAAQLLVQLGEADRKVGIATLVDLTNDRQSYLSSQAQSALMSLGPDAEAAVMPGLIDALKDPGRRTAALFSLQRMSAAAAGKAIPALKELLAEPDVQTRVRAAELLARFATEPATKAAAAGVLSEILKSPERNHHASAASALQMLGPDYARDARQAHRELLKDPFASNRLRAVRNLLQEGNAADRKAVVAVLEELQKAEQPSDRLQAAGLLAEAAPERKGDAAATLLELSHERQWRMSALSALVRLGPPHSLQVLPILRESLKDSTRGGDRGVTVTLFGQLGPAAADAVPEVAAILDDPGMGHSAAYALVRMGPSGVAAVVKALNSEKNVTRQMAILALANVQPPVLDAVPRLVDLAAGSNVGEQKSARAALDKMGAGAVSALTKLLTAPEPHRRRLAAELLAGAESYSKPAVPDLEKALDDKDPIVSRSAARAAFHGGSRSRAVVTTLREILKSDDLTARQDVAKTLGVAWPLPDELVAALKTALHDSDETLRLHAARALVRLDATAAEAGGVIAAAITPTKPSQPALNALCQVGVRPAALRAAAPAVREAVKNLRPPVDPNVVTRVAFALARADGPAAVGPLSQLIEESPVHNYVSAVAQALGECGPDGVAALRKLLRHRDPLLRSVAVDQLGYDARHDATLVPEIVPLLRDSDTQVRTRALLALRAAGPNARPAADAAAECLHDPQPTVRRAAAYAVATIGSSTGRDEALAQIRSILAGLAAPVGDVESTAPEALDALGRYGADAAAAVPDVLALLKLPDVIARAKAVEALGRIGRPAADTVVPVLTDLLKANDAIVRAHAAVALWRITGNAEPVVPVLAASLGEPAVRWTIVQWVMKVRPMVPMPGMVPGPGFPIQIPRGVPVQVYLMFASPIQRPSGPDESVCRLVIQTLAEIGPRAGAAVPALQVLRDDVEEDVRQAAADALKKIKPNEGSND